MICVVKQHHKKPVELVCKEKNQFKQIPTDFATQDFSWISELCDLHRDINVDDEVYLSCMNEKSECAET